MQSIGDLKKATLRFFRTPVFGEDESTRRAELLSFLINLHIGIALTVSLFLGLTADDPIYSISAFLSILPAISLRFLIHWRRLTLASILFVGMIALLMPLIAWQSNSSVTTTSVSVFQAVTIIMAGLLLGGRGALGFLLLTGLINTIMVYAEVNRLFLIDFRRDPIEILLIQIVTFSAIAIMLGRTNRIIRRSFRRAQDSEQRYRGLLENIPAITHINRLGAPNPIEYISPQVEKLCGCSSAEFLHEPGLWIRIIHELDQDRVMQENARCNASGEPFSIDYRIVTKDQRIIWIHDESVIVKDKDGKPLYWLGVWSDITDRKHADAEIHLLATELEQRVISRTAQLEAANRELETFSYSVSHDLRAPLRAITSYATLLKRDSFNMLDENNKEFLEKIIASGYKMGRLIEELLNFSRLGSKGLQIQTVDLNDTVHYVIDTLKAETTGRQINWNLRELPPAQADPLLIQQVLTNLISNAIKYTRMCSPAMIEIGCETQENERVYFVRDNGVGFDMKYANQLFGVFQRLHSESEFEGNGIGLAIVQRILARHGGRIWADAAVNQGATFFFTLPNPTPASS